jgi:hypothetical protein
VDSLKGFLTDERGETSMVLKLVLAVTLSAAAIVILLQLMHINLGTTKRSSGNITTGAKSALEDTMGALSD